MDDQFSIAGGFAVESGRFVAVGDSAGIQKLAGGKTKVVDLGGRTVIPGLIDNHNHFIRGAQHWGTAARLDGISTRAAALEKLKACCDSGHSEVRRRRTEDRRKGGESS